MKTTTLLAHGLASLTCSTFTCAQTAEEIFTTTCATCHMPVTDEKIPDHDKLRARQCSVDAGALSWPNGLQLSPRRLHDLCLMSGAA